MKFCTGCVYVVSTIESAGVIKKIGDFENYFGSHSALCVKVKRAAIL
jgi:hypothetical protein